MEITWALVKDVFFALGSIAGVLALAKPAVDSKADRDKERVQYVKSLINEVALNNLNYSVWHKRSIREDLLRPLDTLSIDLRTNVDQVRFSGPFAKELRDELAAIVDRYEKFREYVQVPEWEPRTIDFDGTSVVIWQFNKQAFMGPDLVISGYEKHLEKASDMASQILLHFQRFQIASELHVIEWPISSWLLRRRYQTLMSSK